MWGMGLGRKMHLQVGGEQRLKLTGGAVWLPHREGHVEELPLLMPGQQRAPLGADPSPW